MVSANYNINFSKYLNKTWISLPNVISGSDLNENQVKLLKRPEIIGVILFSDNLDNKNINNNYTKDFLSIKNLIKSIKKINDKLIFSIDHEGGLIYRFNCIFRPPAAKYFGNIYKKNKKLAIDQCERSAYLSGLDLKKLGIDVCFSPVCDIHEENSQIIGSKLRAFSDDTNTICDLSVAWIKGLNQAGVIGSLKHFPGHGRCELDSHIDYPIDNRTKKQWQNDLNLYKNLFRELNNLKLYYGVMIGHMQVPGLEDTNFHNLNNKSYSPVYSKNIIQNLLRNEMEFDGIVISDCLSMKAADLDLDLDLDLIKNIKCPSYKNNNLSNKINKAYNAGCNWVIASGFDADEMLDIFNMQLDL